MSTPIVHLSRKYTFSASHRLYTDHLSFEENEAIFGKCANPNGHGHNYQLEVTVRGNEGGVSLPAMERVVMTEVVDRFDHKHLNEDCEEFSALNPTVENITRIVWEKLEGKFGTSRLVRVRVWETPKTYAEYTGPVSYLF